MCKIYFEHSSSNPLSYAHHLYIDGKEVTEVVIPEGVTSIGVFAFYGCSITSITIPEGVTSIGHYAFYGCSSLTSINIPESVTSIDRFAFYGCSSLTKAEFASIESLCRINFKDGSSNPLYCAHHLYIDGKEVAEVVIPESVTCINSCTFCDCSSLTSINIPEGVTSIGDWAFSDCSRLSSIVSYAKVPPTCRGYAFSGVPSKAIVYVDKSSVDAYKEAEGWKDLTILTMPNPFITLIDGEEYNNNEEKNWEKITYTRTFNNTNWQALYIPFSMQYEDWCENFDVAYLNDVHQYDTDDDGDIDVSELEVIKMKRGQTEPNMPYLIRAKKTGTQSIVVENTTLYPAEAEKYDVSSWNTLFNFQGTYSGVSGSEMFTNGYYAYGGGALIQAENAASNLKPFRWYMHVTDRYGNRKELNEARISIVFPEDDNETGVQNLSTSEATSRLADGRYMENGKIVIVKNGIKYNLNGQRIN